MTKRQEAMTKVNSAKCTQNLKEDPDKYADGIIAFLESNGAL
jgi:DNA modification methylase